MAEDGEDPRKHVRQNTETFQRAPETRAVEHRFPARLTGVVAVPPGSRGPRSLYLKRYGDSFGFTLRHFIVYPPDSVTDCDPRTEASGAGSGSGYGGGPPSGAPALQPMETIFVRQIAERGPAAIAGLQPGDQILSVNGVSVRDIRSDNKYHEVVQIIKNAPEYLHLLVVPKEEDIIQKFYVHAHHPSSNQHSTQQQLLQQHLQHEQQLQKIFYQQQQEQQAFVALARNQKQQRRQLTTASTLYNPHVRNTILVDPLTFQRGATLANGADHRPMSYGPPRPMVQQKSSDPIYSEPVAVGTHQQQMIHQHQLQQTPHLRQQRSLESCLDGDRYLNEPALPAHQQQEQPVLLRRPAVQTMGRRPSGGNYATSDRDSSTDYYSIAASDELAMMRAATMSANGNSGSMLTAHSNAPGCRRSLDDAIRRRESTSSVSSSMTDGSRSGGVYDSSSTLTGREDMDEEVREKIKQRIQEREDFLNKGSSGNGIHYDTDDIRRQKEYYNRVRKLEKKQVWPPTAADIAMQQEQQHLQLASPSRHQNKPAHQSVQRVRTDIDLERDLDEQKKNNGKFVSHLDRINEKQNYDSNKSTEMDDGRTYQLPTQIVQSKARAFESGQSGDNDRTSYFSSELHRLTSKHAVPNVLDRTKEFESLSTSPPPQSQAQVQMPPPFPLSVSQSAGTVVSDSSWGSIGGGNKRAQQRVHQVQVHQQQAKEEKDSRSLDHSDSSASVASIVEISPKKLSGNLIIPIGSKFIHCVPPSDYKAAKDFSFIDNELGHYRARSNSADSWKAPPFSPNTEAMDTSNLVSAPNTPGSPFFQITTPDLDQSPNLIQNTDHGNPTTPSVSITPASPVPTPLQRPNQLDLDVSGPPKRPTRHLRPPGQADQSFDSLEVSSDKPLVVRRTKNTNITDEDRIMRRESYLKATEGGRLNFEYELSDGEVSPQVLRSAHRRWRPPLFASDIQQLRKLFEDAATSLGGSISGNSSSSVSLEREKGSNILLSELHKQPIVKEGQLICKFTEFEGKRSGDRSWKQCWATLRGPSLFLYKDRHHQSPVGSADNPTTHHHHTSTAEPTLVAEIGVRGSMVQVAADYTKRKNVLRLTSVMPCRQELLLQTDTQDDLQSWVRALQDQADGNIKENDVQDVASPKHHPQLPEPQTLPSSPKASAIAPVQQHLRNRSPTGLTPASKTRKASATASVSSFPATIGSGGGNYGIGEPATSPKLKTWRGRVANTFRKMQGGAGSPNSPTAPECSTFGVPLEHCLPSHHNQHVPRLVEVCTDIVEAKALETVGIYRVPGKKADVTALTDEVNKNYDEVLQIDPRWNDVHVVSSLLKSFFRYIPESLLTNALYPDFIKADKLPLPADRMQATRCLLRQLPPTHYHTLRHLILHLRRIVNHANVNKMEAKNLAIVFGPTIVRSEDNMQTMMNDMTNQCRIVETLLTYADWFFSDDDVESLHLPAPIASAEIFQTDPEGIRADLLRDTNINKVEGLHQTKEQKEKHRVIQTILSAAMKKKKKSNATPSDIRPEPRISNGQSDFTQIQSYNNTYDLKQSTTENITNKISTTASDVENLPQQLQQQSQQQAKYPAKGYFNYKKDTDQVKKLIENFIQETESNLTRSRNADLGSNTTDLRTSTQHHHPHSYSAGNISQPLTLHNTSAPSPLATNPRLSLTSTLSSTATRQPITKTNSASNVFGGMQQQQRSPLAFTTVPKPYNGSIGMGGGSVTDGRIIEYGGLRVVGGPVLRRGSSVENVMAVDGTQVMTGGVQRARYEAEKEAIQRSGSLDSINKFTTGEDGDLVATITKIFDEKKKEFTLSGEDLPFVDESPEKSHKPFSSSLTKNPSIPNSPILYRNPSLHKTQYGIKLSQPNKETIEQPEKDIDSTIGKPDNERFLTTSATNNNNSNNINNNAMTPTKKILTLNLNSSGTNGKLKRSESLNKPERTVSPLHTKLKRSESLNKPGERLKRSDSLTKTEKTESNISKRREMNHSARRAYKDSSTKLKRKNGMPERSIKRRHTVGGTKDPDKVNYLDNRQQEKMSDNKENTQKKSLRTSSPDLSGTRKPTSEQRLLLEVSVMGPDVVVALRQHLVGPRPVSFPETVFSVPLESHV